MSDLLFEYQEFVDEMWIKNDDPDQDMAHAVFGLTEELGETVGLFKRAVRGDDDGLIEEDALTKEMGDMLYYFTKVANMTGITLSEIIHANMRKLRDRHARGVMQGSGDNR